MYSFIKWIADPRKNPLARLHKQALEKNLRAYGLRYEDLLNADGHVEIQEALRRLPKEVIIARNQRLKRASHLFMKHDLLPPNVQAVQTPFRNYLDPMLRLVEKEDQERKALGALSLRGEPFDDLFMIKNIFCTFSLFLRFLIIPH